MPDLSGDIVKFCISLVNEAKDITPGRLLSEIVQGIVVCGLIDSDSEVPANILQQLRSGSKRVSIGVGEGVNSAPPSPIRYDPLKHDTPDLDLRFGKYVHHFQRFTYHANARKMAENRGADLKTREPVRGPDEEPWEMAFLYDVLDLVLICRHVLKYTYVFGFFLEDGKEKELFEFLQEDLEKSTEHLTELLFRELDSLAVPAGSPPDVIHIRNYMKVTRKFLESLIVGLQNGLITDYGPPSPEDMSKKGKKKQKDKQKKMRIGWKKDKAKQPI